MGGSYWHVDKAVPAPTPTMCRARYMAQVSCSTVSLQSTMGAPTSPAHTGLREDLPRCRLPGAALAPIPLWWVLPVMHGLHVPALQGARGLPGEPPP